MLKLLFGVGIGLILALISILVFQQRIKANAPVGSSTPSHSELEPGNPANTAQPVPNPKHVPSPSASTALRQPGDIPQPTADSSVQEHLAQQFRSKSDSMRQAFLAPLDQILSGLGLSDASREEALAVLAEHQRLVDEQMAAVVSGGTPPAMEQMRKQDEDRDRRLRELIGEESFQAYQFQKQTLPERLALERIDRRLSNAGLALEEGARARILEVMLGAAKPQTARVNQAAPPPAPGDRLHRVMSAVMSQTNILNDQQIDVVAGFYEETKALRMAVPGRPNRP